MNPLETQLKNWVPRPPSPCVERRLFGSGNGEKHHAPHVEAWAWLAPLTGLALLVFVVTHPAGWVDPGHYGESAPGTGGRTSDAVMLAQMDAMAYQTLHNHVGSIFESTNSGGSSLTLSSFLLLDTNGLKW